MLDEVQSLGNASQAEVNSAATAAAQASPGAAPNGGAST